MLLAGFFLTGARADEAGATAAEQGGGWRVIGPGGGGAMFCPAISPHDAKLVFVACDMTGSYVSRDGGASWRMFNLQEIVREFAFDADDENVVYARADGLWVSHDRGGNWEKILPAATDGIRRFTVGDHADNWSFNAAGQRVRVTALAVDPAVAGALYATVQTGETHQLLSSKDGGRSWQPGATLARRPLALTLDPTSATADRVVIVADETAITALTPDERSEHGAPAGLALGGFAFGRDAERKCLVIYAITSGENSRLLMSADRGTRWQDLTAHVVAGFPQTKAINLRAIATSAENPALVYLSYRGLVTEDGRPHLGVARSDDCGRTWRFPWMDEARESPVGPAASMMIRGWVDEYFGPEWGENPLAMALDPHDAARVVATDFGRALQTRDGGLTWSPVYTKAKSPGAWVSRGLDVTNVYGLVFDPFDARRVFMPCTDIGLLLSKDGGQSWASAMAAPGFPTRWSNTTYALAFDPKRRGRIWAAVSDIHDLPREKMWRKRAPATFDGGIILSDDGGESWQPTRLDVGEAAVTDLLLDLESPPENRTLYACAFGRGVLKSTDGGLTWNLRNRGIPGSEPLAWRLHRRTSDRALFLVVFRRRDTVENDPALAGALYRSDDEAETWQPVSLPAEVNAPTSVTTEALPERTLLLSAWGRKAAHPPASDTNGGLYRSTDDGRSWTPVLTADAHLSALCADGRSRSHYASGFNGKAYRSTDEGKTWRAIAGFDFKWANRIAPDPADPGRIYVMTFGGGLWHGPVEAPTEPAGSERR